MALFRPCYYILDVGNCRHLLNFSKNGNGYKKLHTSAVKQSRWPQKTKKSSFADMPLKGEPVLENNPINTNTLFKPLLFTVAFSTASIGCCAIWQYENMRKKALSLMKKPITWAQERLRPTKSMEWRNKFNKWWHGLSEGEKLFVPICFANVVVFLAWRIPSLQPVMLRYFCSNPASRVLCWPMILSTFSHYSMFHLGANMYVLHSFCSGAVMALGKEQFLGVYLTAGVVSSFASFFYKVLSKQPGLSLGASGAIMAILGYVCTQFPDTKLSIIFLPMYTFTAGTAIKFIMGLDLAGVLLGWKFFDHAAHLGGALFGICWCYWGNHYVWRKVDPLVHWWHQLRNGEK